MHVQLLDLRHLISEPIERPSDLCSHPIVCRRQYASSEL